jgi:protein-arginine kinase activator protein McsA
MNAEVKKTIELNTKELLQGFDDELITYEEINELHKEAVADEEYEVAVSIRDVLNIILKR